MKTKRKILSSKLTLKFANTGKRNDLVIFLIEYQRIAKEFVTRFFTLLNAGETIPAMPSGDIAKIETWLSARAIQAASKQASGIANGALAKNKRREWQADQFDKSGCPAKARRLRAIIAKNKVSCPMPSNIEAQLDNRFFIIESSLTKTFDSWLTLKSIGSPIGERGVSVKVPLRFHIHYNKLAKHSKRLNTILLSRNSVTFSFELPAPEERSAGTTLGIDIGQTSIFSISSGEQIQSGQHGWTLKKINNRMAARKRGGKGFARSERHCRNFIGESVNKINFVGVSNLRIEKIKNIKKGRKSSRSLSHWSVPDLIGPLKHKAFLLGVQVKEVNPMFTSQRCSCGWVQKANRKGERFVCKKCSNALNADMNGSVNISLDLPLLPKAAREQRWNLKGFFWSLEGFIAPADESIVRQAQKLRKNTASKIGTKIFQ